MFVSLICSLREAWKLRLRKAKLSCTAQMSPFAYGGGGDGPMPVNVLSQSWEYLLPALRVCLFLCPLFLCAKDSGIQIDNQNIPQWVDDQGSRSWTTSRESLLSTENTAPRTRTSSFLNPRLLNKLFLSLFHSFLQFHCLTLCIGSQQPKPLPWGAGVSSGRGAKEHWWGIGFLRFNSLLCSLMVQQVKNLVQSRRHRRCGFSPWVKKVCWRKERLPTPVSLPGEFQGQRSLVDYRLWGCKELDTTETTPHRGQHRAV